MLIIVLTLLSSINAANTLGKIISSVAETFQQSVRVSANHPNAPVLSHLPHYSKSIHNVWDAHSVPSLIVNHKILPFLSFKEAIIGKVTDEREIIKYFSSKAYKDPKLQKETYKDIINYIVRDLGNQEISDQTRINNLEIFFNSAKDEKNFLLNRNDIDNIFANGKLDLLKYLVGKENIYQFKDFRFLPEALAARNGHIEMVKWLMERNPSLVNYGKMIVSSINQDQRPTFTAVLDLVAKEKPKMRMDIYTEALASSFYHRRKGYVDYVLQKATESFKNPNELSKWSENFLKMYSQKKNQPTVSTIDYFFSQKVWNPRTVSSILFAMSKATDTVVERIGRELLNPRFKFRDSKGSDPLQKAIELATLKNKETYGRVKQVLESIQRKRPAVIGEQVPLSKRPRLGEPVYLDGFGFFHPVL